MSTKPGRLGSSLARLFQWSHAFQGAGLQLLAVIALAVCLIVGFYLAWNKWRPVVLARADYVVRAENIEIPPQPRWIHDVDVKSEVIRDGSLTDLSILDTQLPIKVANAFQAHTWVREVDFVRKVPPARVIVQLRYREPIALVEVILDNGRRALQPVDVEGFVLPTEYLLDHPQEIRNFLRIVAGYGMPAGPEGTSWGDPRVTAGARIAAALQDVWQGLGLYRVVAEETRDRSSSELTTYELRTRLGTRVFWGHAPGSEVSGEAASEVKVARLQQFVQKNGPLDQHHARGVIDLRRAAGLTVTPHTATARGGFP